MCTGEAAEGGGGAGRELLGERKKDKRSETQGRLLAEQAAWRGYRTSSKAATVTGKRGSIYY